MIRRNAGKKNQKNYFSKCPDNLGQAVKEMCDLVLEDSDFQN